MRVLLVVVIAVVVGFAGVQPATAWGLEHGGSPGRLVSVPVAQITVGCGPYTGQGCVQYVHLTTPAGPTVGRSPASSGTQNLGLIYKVQYRSGGNAAWTDHYSKQYTSSIGPDQQQVQLPQLPIEYRNMPHGDYRLFMFVGWMDERGNSLGHSMAYPREPEDHRCETGRYRACQAYPGYVRI